MKFLPVLSAIALTFSASQAMAASEQQFNSLDADGDGFLTVEEILPAVTKLLEKKGSDVSQAEQFANKRLQSKDANADGKVSLEEFLG